MNEAASDSTSSPDPQSATNTSATNIPSASDENRWRRAVEISDAPEERVADLKRHLFGLDNDLRNVFAVLDAAGLPNLPALLQEHGRPHCCLFSGKLEPGVAECAPYLVDLTRDDAFTALVLTEGWGEAWGVFAVLPKEIGFRDVRKHFRSFLRVRGPEGKPVFFRYYDPRVFQLYLPTCTAEELDTVLGPVLRYAMEPPEAKELLLFERNDEEDAPC